MRLDARRGDYGYRVYDAKRCLVVDSCLWCDDQTAQWGRTNHAMTVAIGEQQCDVIKEDRIVIYLEFKLVVFNQLDDGESMIDSVSQRCTA